MQIEQLISELLLRHACVVIPNFGGFITSQLSASIDYRSGSMMPPKKAVLFNKQLTNNDGLLLAAIAQELSCPYQDAENQLKTIVQGWWESLHSGKRISLEKVGFLYLDSENNLQFEQDRFFNLLLQSYGLTQVKFVSETQVTQEIPHKIEQEAVVIPLEIKTAETAPIRKKEEQMEPAIVVQLPRRKIMRYVAAACLLPIAFYSFWLPTRTDVLESGLLSFHDLNPFHETKAAKYESKQFSTKFKAVEQAARFDDLIKSVPESIEVYPLEFENSEDDVELFYVRLKESTSATVEPEAISLEETPGQKQSIQVIAGAFSNENNAQNLVNQLKEEGFSSAKIVDNGGMYRVIAASESSAALAQKKVNELQNKGISSWILK